jgi:hypothetical protein
MQVQEYLRSKTLADLSAELGIKATRHKTFPNLVLLKYDQIDSPNAHPIVVECRGLILDESLDWSVISRPYDRFFNYGDGNAAQIDWTTAKVYEKLDGSLMTLYWYDGEWRVASSGTPDASGPVNNDSSGTFADLFWRTWNELGYQPPMQKSLCCYMFELMTPANRVIVPHTENRLVLHGVRQLIHDYPGFNYNELDPATIAATNGWECVKSHPITSFEDCVRASEALNPMQCEGFIVVDAKFNRVKVKSPQYVALSHMKDGFSNRRMIDLVKANEGSEFLSYFPEYQPLYEKIKTRYDNLVVELTEAYERIKDIPVQKDFALEACKHKWSAPLFAIRNKKSPSIIDFIKSVGVDALEKHLGA